MSQSVPMSQAITKLNNSLSDLLHYAATDLVRESALGDLNFAESKKTFDNIFNLFREVSSSDLPSLPTVAINGIQQQANAAVSFFARVAQFTLADQNPYQTRNALIGEAEGLWFQVFQAVAPSIAYVRRESPDSSKITKELRENLVSQQSAIKASSDERDAILEDMRKTLTTIKDAAAEAGVTRHSGYFKDEADAHSESANRWLFVSFGFGLLMLVYAAVIFWFDHPAAADANFYSTIHLIIPRLTFLLVLGFALVWSSRNYSAARHNEVVNRHRQNALNSFETFVRGAQDAETKNAVLLQATQSIFAPQDTAFTKNDMPTGPGTQIVEIVRGMSSGKSN